MPKVRDYFPLTRTVRLTDREIEAITARWWKRLFFTQAQHRAYDRARAIIRDGNAEVATREMISELERRDM